MKYWLPLVVGNIQRQKEEEYKGIWGTYLLKKHRGQKYYKTGHGREANEYQNM